MNATTPGKKLIEVALPLDAINEASAREKSIRHGHPSTLHLWWARRPLAAALARRDAGRDRVATRTARRPGATHGAGTVIDARRDRLRQPAAGRPAHDAIRAVIGPMVMTSLGRNTRARMGDRAARDTGVPMASGAVAAANPTLVGVRMTRSGANWGRSGGRSRRQRPSAGPQDRQPTPTALWGLTQPSRRASTQGPGRDLILDRTGTRTTECRPRWWGQSGLLIAAEQFTAQPDPRKAPAAHEQIVRAPCAAAGAVGVSQAAVL